MKRLLLIGLIMGSTLFADSPEEVLQQANEYLQAGFYEEAESLYRELLNIPLESWQQDIVFYNLGTVLMKEQKWQQAISEFLRINGDNSPPYLTDSLNNNLALALVGMAYNLKDAKNTSLASNILKLVKDNFEIPLKLETIEPSPEEIPKIEPAAILGQAINQEEKALLASLKDAIFKLQNKQTLEVAHQKQQETIQSAELFIPSLLKWEKSVYSENHCLEKPFDEMVPLFSQGFLAAKKADQLLANKKFDQAINYQWQALNSWKKALAMWSQIQRDLAKETIQVKDSDKFNLLVEEIIEMSFDDKLPPEKEGQTESAERPW